MRLSAGTTMSVRRGGMVASNDLEACITSAACGGSSTSIKKMIHPFTWMPALSSLQLSAASTAISRQPVTFVFPIPPTPPLPEIPAPPMSNNIQVMMCMPAEGDLHISVSFTLQTPGTLIPLLPPTLSHLNFLVTFLVLDRRRFAFHKRLLSANRSRSVCK
jgi:hypothetical protein